jgi:hypothetical protein
MSEVLRYRGQTISTDQIAFFKQFIASHSDSSRWKLSRQLCESLGWKQANGALRDIICRGLLLMLERAGHIELPPVRRDTQRQRQKAHLPPPVVSIDSTPLETPFNSLGPIEILLVRRTPNELLFNSLLDVFHYLGYDRPVGEHLKYLICAQGRPVACLAWSSAPRHLGARDRFIRWDAAARRRNIQLVAYNSRFLILPWVRIPHLASHILGRTAARISSDWEQAYAHPIYLLETFIDPERFRGSCYRAANWISVGFTTGRGKDDRTHRPNRPIKEVLVLPLCRQFRRVLVA